MALAKRLAHNEKEVRDQGMKSLKQWLFKRKEVSEMDMMKIWKGLFYCKPDTHIESGACKVKHKQRRHRLATGAADP